MFLLYLQQPTKHHFAEHVYNEITIESKFEHTVWRHISWLRECEEILTFTVTTYPRSSDQTADFAHFQAYK